MSLPYVTADLPGIGGTIRQRSEDFFVQELPLYEPSGQGEHVYAEIQKINITTFEAVDRIARQLRISGRDIGFAGMKDARAVTRQVLSIPGVTPEQVQAMQVQDVTVLWASQHTNKLRLGHLWGNRFAIKIRGVSATDVVKAQPIVERLAKVGMPNYFGEQRFGRREDNHLLGAALIRGDDAEVLRLLLGNPMPRVDDAQALGARKAYEAGDLEQAMRLFPRRSGMERRILARLIKTGNPTAAVKAVEERLRRLWVSALQSELFNQVVARRASTLGTLMQGDLAYKHGHGAVFRVEDPAIEQPRADAFEISPSGPLVGYRVTLPEGEPLRIEQEVLSAAGIKPEDFRVSGRVRAKGERRPLRVQPKDIEVAGGVDAFGAHVTVAFSLPAGCFATVLLREVMKADLLEQTSACR